MLFCLLYPWNLWVPSPRYESKNYSMNEVVNSYFNLEFRFKASEMTQKDY